MSKVTIFSFFNLIKMKLSKSKNIKIGCLILELNEKITTALNKAEKTLKD